MVGSVLMQRMAAERDFDHIDPVFFSTSQAGGTGAGSSAASPAPLQDANDIDALAKCDVDRHLPGRRLHQRGPSEAARRRLARLLDRCGLRAAHEGRRGDHPRSRSIAT